jgi:hypothetical protein
LVVESEGKEQRMNVKAERTNRFSFPRQQEEIDEYRITTIPDNITIGYVQQRYSQRTRQIDYRPQAVGIRGRAHSWTCDVDKAIERLIRNATKLSKSEEEELFQRLTDWQ